MRILRAARATFQEKQARAQMALPPGPEATPAAAAPAVGGGGKKRKRKGGVKTAGGCDASVQ